jgi:HD-GYP domain-containing protein (c-di-GMP phosphodiesterase class II)
MWTQQDIMQRILEMHRELAEVNDLDILLERILTRARQFVQADAGSIYLRDGDTLQFSYTQNNTLSRRLPPGKKLIYQTFHVPINHASIAGYVAHTGDMLNIPDVYALDPTLPYSFGREFDRLSQYHTQSMLTAPLKTSQGTIVGVLQIINATDADGTIIPFSQEAETIVSLFASMAAIALERAQMTRALILRMISMAELRDPKETGAHVNRVGAYALEIYEQWAMAHGVSEAEIDHNRDILRMAAMLHDVGKVSISDMILKKPGKLTPEEFNTMKSHTFTGAQLFASAHSELDRAAAEVALNHHENWIGTGYPGYCDIATGAPLPGMADEQGRARGKRGEEIPLFGRIVALADVYDALCSKRVYKDAMAEDEVLEIIRQETGTKFDPDIVAAFYECLDVLHAIRERYKDPEHESVAV